MSPAENDTVNEIVVSDEPLKIDYNTHPLEKGQYWVSGPNLVGLILDVNEYAILFQVLMGISEDNTPVFDFQAGQELFSHERFRKRLQEQKATLAKPDKDLLNVALSTYRKLRNNGEIFGSKELPYGEKEGQEFLEYEHYVVERVIVPPPKKVRDKKGFHWLKTGASGTLYSLKMWDPELDNWVLPDGNVDTTARIGFVKSYHAEAMVLTDINGRETIDQLSTRVIDFLKSKGFFFDEKFIAEEFRLHSKILVAPEEDTCPVYQFVYTTSSVINQLTLVFYTDSKIVFRIVFDDIQNGEFIPNKHSICFLYS